MLGSFNSSSPFSDSRPMTGEDTRFSGPYEGQYLDPEQEQLWESAYDKKAEYFVYVKSYNEKYLGKPFYNPHLAWALRILAKANLDINEAKDETHEMIIRQVLEDARQRNSDLFSEAEAFIAEQDELARKEFVKTIQIATLALAEGDLEKYREAEEKLHHTNPIPTEAIRAKLQADQKFID